MKSAAEQADAIAAEVLTPEGLDKIEQTIISLNAGQDPRLVLRTFYGLAYMDGMLAMAKVGMPQ